MPLRSVGEQVPAASTLPEMLRDCATTASARLALVVGAARWTYADLATEANRVANGLAGLGVSDGDVVALLAPNGTEWIAAAFGAMQCGARVDAFNTWVKAHELDYLLRTSRASVLIIADRVRSNDLLSELESLLPELATSPSGGWHSPRYPRLRQVVVIGGSAIPNGTVRWTKVVQAPAHDMQFQNRELGHAESAAFVLYTSGTTENPKAVPLCHRDLIINGFYIGERMGLSEDDRVWFGSPLFWSYGCANALMATMTHQACFVVQERFEAEVAAELMRVERVTAAYLLPTMIDSLTTTHNGMVAQRVRKISSLRTGLTIGRPEEVERAATELGISEICNVYGSTETYGNCCVTDRRLALSVRLRSQGTPLPGVEVRVVDIDSGVVLPCDVAGELQVRGRVTPGYLNNDDLNSTAFTPDGWYRTGDEATVSADESVSFIGRIADMIKTSGINVSPAEVESFISTHPDVAEVLVLGAPHPSRTQVVVAFVVSRSGNLSGDDVISFCKGRIASYKIPWAVSVVARLPHTATGKLLRRDLAETGAALVDGAIQRNVTSPA